MSVKCPKCQTDNPDTQKFCGECAAPLPQSKDIPVTKTMETPKEELTRGTIFADRYEIIEVLGEGGMGNVYRVEDTKINEDVALKLIKPEISSDKKTIERFSNELKLARKLRHKNICQMFDLGEAEGIHFITMEYVTGEDLKSLIRRVRRLDSATAITIAKQVCEGLSEAHRMGVVHRDLKPSNIMIDKEGNARIMDFGIARSVATKGITDKGVMIGTPEYMSPEQVEGKDTDQRSDIYSLGVMLYEMVAGKVPFEGDTPFTIGMKQKGDIPKDPKELNAQIPEDLSSVIMRCLEKDKDKRYQRTGDVRSELIKIEEGIPTTEREVPKRKPLTSKEITVTFGLRKLLIPVLLVIAFMVTGLIIWSPWKQKESANVPSGKLSIAVLPFDDFSQQKDQEYFCDGMANSIINSLSAIKSIVVRARSSSFTFKGKQIEIKEIGERLNVETLLTGNVQKSGDRLRITAQLIKVADESLLWSNQYNRQLIDIFAIQDEITLAIVEVLKIRLLGEEKAVLLKRSTDNLRAYDLYLLGLHHWNRFTEQDVNMSIEYFEQAISIDPNYALAYVGLADCYTILGLGHGSGTHQPMAMFYKAKHAVEKALEIDSTLGEAYSALGFLYFTFEFEWKLGEEAFERAIQLKPSLAHAETRYALLLACLGRFNEAIKESKRGITLDPLAPIYYSDLGYIYQWSRQYDKAIAPAEKALELNPDFLPALFLLAEVYTRKGMFEAAIKETQKLVVLSEKNPENEALLGYLFAITDKREDAQEILDDLLERSKHTYVSAYEIARIYIGLGKKNEALRWLEKAYEERAYWIVQLKIDEDFDVLHDEPRFLALLEKMGLN